MTEQEYNAAEGVRRSDLWKMNESPEKFRWYQEHPMEQTPAMAFGSACHKLVLEPKDWMREFAIAPAADRRSMEGKKAWAEFCEVNAGKTVVSLDDYEKMAAMRDALEKHLLAKKLILGKGQSEVPFFWTDPETGEKCKVKCDRVVMWNRRRYVVDYKTCKTAQTDRFCHEMFKLGYHVQAAMYTEGVMRTKRMRKRPRFIFVAQEKDPPYSVNVIEVTDDVMEAGNRMYHKLLDRYHECKAADIWPGFCEDTLPNETILPGWYSLDGETE